MTAIAINFARTENANLLGTAKSGFEAIVEWGIYRVVNVGKGSKPWRATIETNTGVTFVVGDEQIKTKKAAVAACEHHAEFGPATEGDKVGHDAARQLLELVDSGWTPAGGAEEPKDGEWVFEPSAEPQLEDATWRLVGSRVHLQVHQDGTFGPVEALDDGKFRFHPEMRDLDEAKAFAEKLTAEPTEQPKVQAPAPSTDGDVELVQALGATETGDADKAAQVSNPRKLKAMLKADGMSKTTFANRKGTLAPAYVMWRMDGDMYRLCSVLINAGLAGEWVAYEDLCEIFGCDKEAETDRRSGKGALKSFDRYLRECELGSKIGQFGWVMETENRDPKSKSWDGATMRIVPREGCEPHRINGAIVPLTCLPTRQAELFCAAYFGETREQWGLDLASDFASDSGQTVEEYIADNGNPSDCPHYFAEGLANHGFEAVTR